MIISNVFKLGKARRHCVTKGNILLRASLSFCLSDAFLSLNFAWPERCFDPANNGQTGCINSTSRKYCYCYQNSQWQLTRFQVESKPQSCLRIVVTKRRNDLQPPKTTYNHLKPPTTIYNHLEKFNNHLQPPQKHLQPPTNNRIPS